VAKNPNVLPLNEAIKIVHPLNFKSVRAYHTWWVKTKPENLAKKANQYYLNKGEWSREKKDEFWTFYFGNTITSNQTKSKRFNDMTWSEGQRILREKGIRTISQYDDAKENGELQELPPKPSEYWKDVWKKNGGLSGFVESRPKAYREHILPYDEAKIFIQQVTWNGRRITSGPIYRAWAKTEQRPAGMPANPEREYKGRGWKTDGTGWMDFLGTENVANKNKEFWSFKKCKEWLHKHDDVNGQKAFYEGKKNGTIPKKIPASYRTIFKDEFTTDGDFFGTGNIAARDKFIDAPVFSIAKKQYQKIAVDFEIKTFTEWKNRIDEIKLPSNLPPHPGSVYTEKRAKEKLGIKNPISGIDYYLDFNDTFGIENTDWDARRVKEFLKEILDSKTLDVPSRGIILLRLFIDHKLGTIGKQNQYYELLRKLPFLAGYEKEIEKIQNFVESNSTTPPPLNVNSPFTNSDYTEEVNKDESDSKEDSEKPLEQILQSHQAPDASNVFNMTSLLKGKIVSSKSELTKFIQNFLLHELWDSAFNDEDDTLRVINEKIKSGIAIDKRIAEQFLKEFNQVKKIRIPSNYSFSDNNGKPLLPNLMQLYTAYQTKKRKNFANLSEPGTGKTLSAILASRLHNSKKCIVICPLNVVEQWAQRIDDQYCLKNKEREYDSYFEKLTAFTNKDIFEKKSEKPTYHVINYDKFNQSYSNNLVERLKKHKYDFIILDEIQKAKRRTMGERKSKRRKSLENLIYSLKDNPKTKTLFLTATPIVNNLKEGVSFLNLLENKDYVDLQMGNPLIVNAVMLHEKLRNVSIRSKQNLKNLVKEHPPHKVTKTILASEASKIQTVLDIEEKLTDARIKKIVKLIQDKTIIYTENVGQSQDEHTIVEKISTALKKANKTVGYFTGSRKDGKKKFIDGELDVLIASLPLSIGNDGFQKVCNTLIFNVLPWTYADYEQIIGRLARGGQNKQVDVHIVAATLKVNKRESYKWDEKVKMGNLLFKKTLAECAVDGIPPFRTSKASFQRRAKLAIKNINADLTSGDNFIIRPKLESSPPTETKLKSKTHNLGDFSKMNLRFNQNSSAQNMNWLKANPDEWHKYHKLQEKTFEEKGYQPSDIWIDRIKKMSSRLTIADFGCGKAYVSKTFPGRVLSFDLVANDSSVIECNIKSVKEYVGDGDIDIALFSMSLMGKDWKDFLKEAWRCLPADGHLFISNTTKQMNEKFIDLHEFLKEIGFIVERTFEEDILTCIEAKKSDKINQ
tara:strand:- start:234 stop:3980 length:3747 start_codon:yes stop_codon:yes gene_type:complete